MAAFIYPSDRNMNPNYLNQLIAKMKFTPEELEVSQIFLQNLIIRQSYDHALFKMGIQSSPLMQMQKINEELRDDFEHYGPAMTIASNSTNKVLRKLIKCTDILAKDRAPDIEVNKIESYLKNLPMLAPILLKLNYINAANSLHEALIHGYLGFKITPKDAETILQLCKSDRIKLGEWQQSILWFTNELGNPEITDPKVFHKALSEMRFNFVIQKINRKVPYFESKVIQYFYGGSALEKPENIVY
jgi:hypothetical protein